MCGEPESEVAGARCGLRLSADATTCMRAVRPPCAGTPVPEARRQRRARARQVVEGGGERRAERRRRRDGGGSAHCLGGAELCVSVEEPGGRPTGALGAAARRGPPGCEQVASPSWRRRGGDSGAQRRERERTPGACIGHLGVPGGIERLSRAQRGCAAAPSHRRLLIAEPRCSYLAMPGNTSDGDLWNPPDAETCEAFPRASPLRARCVWRRVRVAARCCAECERIACCTEERAWMLARGAVSGP